MLRKLRKSKNIIAKEISEELNISEKSVYRFEKNILKNRTIKYLMFLRKKKVNINKLLDSLK